MPAETSLHATAARYRVDRDHPLLLQPPSGMQLVVQPLTRLHLVVLERHPAHGYH